MVGDCSGDRQRVTRSSTLDLGFKTPPAPAPIETCGAYIGGVPDGCGDWFELENVGTPCRLKLAQARSIGKIGEPTHDPPQ